MRRLLVSTIAAAIFFSACGDGSPSVTETATGFAPTAVPVEAPTTTAVAAPVPTTAAPPTTNPTTTPNPDWGVCVNTQRGYSVGHPAGWHTAYGCRYLDPDPLDIPPNTDGFFSAIAVVDGDTSFEQASQRVTDRHAVIVLREETTVGGRRAVRYETEATGQGLFDKGSRLYSYVLDHDGRSFEVLTAWFPGTSTSEYQLRKKTADQVVKTVRFL